jgi:hypothetical protein
VARAATCGRSFDAAHVKNHVSRGDIPRPGTFHILGHRFAQGCLTTLTTCSRTRSAHHGRISSHSERDDVICHVPVRVSSNEGWSDMGRDCPKEMLLSTQTSRSGVVGNSSQARQPAPTGDCFVLLEISAKILAYFWWREPYFPGQLR